MTNAASSTTREGPREWRDGKRRRWLLSLLPASIPFLCAGLVQATGLGLFWWSGLFLVYLIAAPLDLLIGTDRSNPPASAVARLEEDPYYRWIAALYMPIQYGAFIFSAWLVARGGLSAFETLGLTMSVGMMNGIGIANAHELGHKTSRWERWLAKVALAPTFYGHFEVEHNRGHHVRVATPEDPASARMGESFWAFLPRTVIGGVRSGWNLEKARLARAGLGPLHWRNEVLNAWAMTPALFGLLLFWLGPAIIPFLVIQGVFGFSLLEVVNYVEHYGLKRARLPDGRYERCGPEHSWNSNHVVTNVMLYHLQRHSDHHAHPLRRYQALRHFDDAPQLPTGYAGMTAVAYLPPLWRWLMDRRVVAHYGGDLSRINLHPPQREAIYARWAGHMKAADA